MQVQILSIDDAIDHQQVIAATFSNHYSVIQAFTLTEAKRELEYRNFDLILLDVTLPDGDGFSFYADFQNNESQRDIPVIFLTSRQEISSEVMGFSLGAEDYIVKPIEPARLKARIDAKLKHLESRKHKELIVQKGNLKINVSLQRATLLQEGKESKLDLTPVEFKLLFHFLKYEDHVFNRKQLLETLWETESSQIFDRTVDMHVSNLRRKIVQSGFKIKAVHGLGYRLMRSK